MKKLMAILWKDVVLRFTDPGVLLLAIALPLAITALIELAFGNLVLGRGMPDATIPVGIVNQDEGGRWGNIGEILPYAIISGTEKSTYRTSMAGELFTVIELDDEGKARRMVEREELMAALFIPPGFSQDLANERATITTYINDRYMFRGVAFKSLVEMLAALISTGEVTVRATVQGLLQQPGMRGRLESGELDEPLADLAVTAAMLESNPIKVQVTESVGQFVQMQLTHYLAAAVAIFFAGYTALLGSASMLREKAQGTLQRMYTTATRPGIMLAGKTLGPYLKGLIQMGTLLASITVMEWALGGAGDATQRSDVAGLCLLVVTGVAAATGTGVLAAGLARTYAQAATYGSGVLLVMALAGGIFFPVDLFPRPMQIVSRITFHYWAMDGYVALALGGGLIDVWPHLVVLGLGGLSLVGIGGWLLRRRVGLS